MSSGIIITSDQCGSQDELPGSRQVLPSYRMDRRTIVWYKGMRCGMKSECTQVWNYAKCWRLLVDKILLLVASVILLCYEAYTRFQQIKDTAVEQSMAI